MIDFRDFMKRKKKLTGYNKHVLVTHFMGRYQRFLEKIKHNGHRSGTNAYFSLNSNYDLKNTIISYEGDKMAKLVTLFGMYYLDSRYLFISLESEEYTSLYNYLNDIFKNVFDKYGNKYIIDFDKINDIDFDENEYREYEDSNKFGL